MSGPTAFCPRCRKETRFVEAGGARQCSECGLEFALSEARLPERSSVGSEVMGMVGVLVRVVLIMIGIVVVVLGVLFAGCAVLMSGLH